MLQRRQIPWKAVGLTAAIVRCALTTSSRRKAPGREDQRRGGGATKRQEAQRTESRQEQHQAKETAGASKTNQPRAAYPVEKAGKATPMSGQSNGCWTCHLGGFPVFHRTEPRAASFRLDDEPGTNALTLPVPLKTLLEDQEAWEKYLRRSGTGEKRTRPKAKKVRRALLEASRRGTKKLKTKITRVTRKTKEINPVRVEEDLPHDPRATPP